VRVVANCFMSPWIIVVPRRTKRLNAQDISTVRPGDTVYVDLKVFSGRWYESLDLPDWRDTRYVMEFQFTHWYRDTSYKKFWRPNTSYTGKKNRISGKYLLGGATDVIAKL
jgi:hypothetical protein